MGDIKKAVRAEEPAKPVSEGTEETQAVVNPEDLDSEVRGLNGRPVVRYNSLDEKRRYDKQYTVRVTDIMRGADAVGNASVTRAGYKYVFPLGEPVKMYGFQILQLRGCTYTAPKTDIVDGNLKKTGTYERSRFRVEVEDDI